MCCGAFNSLLRDQMLRCDVIAWLRVGGFSFNSLLRDQRIYDLGAESLHACFQFPLTGSVTTFGLAFMGVDTTFNSLLRDQLVLVCFCMRFRGFPFNSLLRDQDNSWGLAGREWELWLSIPSYGISARNLGWDIGFAKTFLSIPSYGISFDKVFIIEGRELAFQFPLTGSEYHFPRRYPQYAKPHLTFNSLLRDQVARGHVHYHLVAQIAFNSLLRDQPNQTLPVLFGSAFKLSIPSYGISKPLVSSHTLVSCVYFQFPLTGSGKFDCG